MIFSKEQKTILLELFDPKEQKNIILAGKIVKFNQVILFGLLLGVFPGMITAVYVKIYSVKWLVFFHAIIRFVLPLSIYWLSPFLKNMYNVIKKNYITQIIIGGIFVLIFILAYSSDLGGQITKLLQNLA